MESPDSRRSELLQDFERALSAGRDLVLDEALLIVSSVITEDVDIVESLVLLDEIASSIPSPTMIGIARHLFSGPSPFTGNAAEYYDPSNSFLDRVLMRRIGIPISLSVLMMEVGRRLGIRLCGVGMPGHFVVGSPTEIGSVPDTFVDPFNGGAVLSAEDCRRLFRRMTGGRSVDNSFLEAVDPISIVDRSLNNLKAIYASNGNTVALSRVMQLRILLPTSPKEEYSEYLRVMAPFN